MAIDVTGGLTNLGLSYLFNRYLEGAIDTNKKPELTTYTGGSNKEALRNAIKNYHEVGGARSTNKSNELQKDVLSSAGQIVLGGVQGNVPGMLMGGARYLGAIGLSAFGGDNRNVPLEQDIGIYEGALKISDLIESPEYKENPEQFSEQLNTIYHQMHESGKSGYLGNGSENRGNLDDLQMDKVLHDIGVPKETLNGALGYETPDFSKINYRDWMKQSNEAYVNEFQKRAGAPINPQDVENDQYGAYDKYKGIMNDWNWYNQRPYKEGEPRNPGISYGVYNIGFDPGVGSGPALV